MINIEKVTTYKLNLKLSEEQMWDLLTVLEYNCGVDNSVCMEYWVEDLHDDIAKALNLNHNRMIRKEMEKEGDEK